MDTYIHMEIWSEDRTVSDRAAAEILRREALFSATKDGSDIRRINTAHGQPVTVDPETAEKFGVKEKQIVKVAVGGEGRKLIFDDVVIRVSPKFAPAMHIDTDEANAASIAGAVEGEVIVD